MQKWHSGQGYDARRRGAYHWPNWRGDVVAWGPRSKHHHAGHRHRYCTNALLLEVWCGMKSLHIISLDGRLCKVGIYVYLMYLCIVWICLICWMLFDVCCRAFWTPSFCIVAHPGCFSTTRLALLQMVDESSRVLHGSSWVPRLSACFCIAHVDHF